MSLINDGYAQNKAEKRVLLENINNTPDSLFLAS